MSLLLFLDIDGVLNNEQWWDENCTKNREQNRPYFRSIFCTANTQWLKKLYTSQPTTIVISSSWRKLYTMDELKAIFKANGLKESLIFSVTPYSYYSRGLEIKEWIKKHTIVTVNHDTMLIIDDTVHDIYKEFDKINIIRVDSKVGFNEKCYKEALSKIQKQQMEKGICIKSISKNLVQQQ